MSIALFFLLSGFFLTVLLGALEHSGKLLAISGACLAAVVCIIVFLAPVELPRFHSQTGSPLRQAVTTSTLESADDSDVGGSTVPDPTTTVSAWSPTTVISSVQGR